MDTICYVLAGVIVVIGALMIYANNSKHKAKYDELVKQAKAKGVDILSDK
jgi:hypothetical protein